MPPSTFRLIRSGPLTGASNMALDAAIAEGPSPPEPTVRLYRWDPWALSLGWFQAVKEGDLARFRAAGLGVTRRTTGGGAILHSDEVTYAVILPSGDPRIPAETAASYHWLHEAVREALAEVGVETATRGTADSPAGPDPFFCFARTAAIDLLASGRKLVGSAQRRTRTAFLQHGSIPLTPNGTAPGATSVLEERGGSPILPETLEEALGRAFARILGANPVASAPAAEESARAASLETTSFGNPDWVLRPRKGRGRDPEPPPDFLRLLPAALAPLRALRAAVEEEGLRVTASLGGGHPFLPHRRLLALEAARVPRLESRPLTLDRDPWDSTFRRSHFAETAGPAGPEGSGPTRHPVEEEDLFLLLLYGSPFEAVRLDARRFHYADLGDRRTGEWRRDARTLLQDLLARVPGVPAGPGAAAFLAGGLPPALPGEGALGAAVVAVAGGREANPPPLNS